MEQDILDSYLKGCQALWEKDVKHNYKPGSDPLPDMTSVLSKIESAFSAVYGMLDNQSRQDILKEWQSVE